jgi:RNA polymerase sigma-70 factor (ECF subfamily)
MQRVADGDFDAFERLYERFAPVLMYFFCCQGINLTVAEDLTQRVFASLLEQRSDFRAESSFETYLFSIAWRMLSREIRESHRSPKKGLKGRSEPIKDSPDDLSQPELELYLKELTAAIEEAKGKLTERQRQVLDAANALDIDLSGASNKIGYSHDAFKKRLERARKRLRELLAPFLNDENNS